MIKNRTNPEIAQEINKIIETYVKHMSFITNYRYHINDQQLYTLYENI